MPKKRRSHRHGFSLIEAAIVLGIVGLVIGGIWVAAAAVNASMKTSDTLKAITTTMMRIQSRYKGIPVTGYEYISENADLARVLLYPDLADVNGNMRPIMGDDLSVAVHEINVGVNELTYLYYGLTLSDCMNLSTSLLRTFQKDQMFSGVYIKTGEYTNDHLTAPNQARSKCEASIDDDGEFAKVELDMLIN